MPTEPSNPILPPLPRTPQRRRRVFDVGLVFALTWLLLAVGVTVVWGPDLGLRGWVWLLVHHALCGVGCLHEVRRAWQRRQSR